MALTPGTRFGVHEITDVIGSGGMGEVYRARDTVLDRDVALKVLPDQFVRDPERLIRFDREAKTLASLNHPNIAHIYGIETAPTARAPSSWSSSRERTFASGSREGPCRSTRSCPWHGKLPRRSKLHTPAA